MDPTFLQVLTSLETAQVRFLVVGGVAVVLHGVLRMTVDLDLVIELQPDNLLPAIRALAALGFSPRLPVAATDLADAATRRAWIAERNLRVFTFWHPKSHRVVDVFVEEPFNFDAAWSRRVDVDIHPTVVHVAAIEDLVSMKRAAGRAKDLADIDALMALEEEDGE
ncbi:MAG TPA: hypothetical protein PKA64_01475 [Myxococcota bacterium]|nr:hypothetical protein [Myxococcota bacterium]